MKIKLSQLRRIIKEEVSRFLSESSISPNDIVVMGRGQITSTKKITNLQCKIPGVAGPGLEGEVFFEFGLSGGGPVKMHPNSVDAIRSVFTTEEDLQDLLSAVDEKRKQLEGGPSIRSREYEEPAKVRGRNAPFTREDPPGYLPGD